MGKIFLIIQREYLSRVKKTSFLIMTIVGPLLMSSVLIVPMWLAVRDHEVEQKIQVLDQSFLFRDSIPQNKKVKFIYSNDSLNTALGNFGKTDYTAILWIPPTILSGGAAVKLFYKEQPG